MKALLLSHSDGGGGAGRAAYRLHQALGASGVDSLMRVDVKGTSDPFVTGPIGSLAELGYRARVMAELAPGISARVADPGLFSAAITSGPRARAINACPADVVNIHWINMGFLSIAQLGRIRKPIVWTLHDMWAFAAGRNYAPEGPDARWRLPYTAANAPSDASRWDVDRWVWSRKRRHWTTPHQLVAPSRWLAQLSRESDLLGHWPVAVIPNPLDTAVYRPYPREEARSFHRLPPGAPLVLFALTTDLHDPRKGWDLLKEALPRLRLDMPDVELVILGHDAPPGPWDPALPPAHWLGRVLDDRSLAMAYSAADVTVVPSRQDNLPQTGTEAQACGCPVVAFRIGGMEDVVEHGTTGALAEELDPVSLAHALMWTLADMDRRQALADRARVRAHRLWAEDAVARQYIDVFEAAVTSRHG